MSSHENDITRITEHLYAQFNDETAQNELRAMSPIGFDWVERTKQTIDTLVPRLPKLADDLCKHVPNRLNAASHIVDCVRQGKNFISSTQEAQDWFKRLNEYGLTAEQLISNIESQQVSAEIQRFIHSDEGLGDLVYANGNSIYPDLILKNHDYTGLPFQDRRAPVDGPCLQGRENPRPSNVPDGCEIKTNRNKRVRVDAHGAHPGLHLGVTWNFSDNGININGVWVGYIRLADHKESGRNVKVTTVKYSFGHKLFVNIL